MSVYPFETDSDEELPRVDDDITEVGGDAINALRDAMFNVQDELGSVESAGDGIGPSGSLDSLADRINISINANGTIKASALTSVGLVVLPITDNQVANAAGIKEFKLDLDFSTVDLNTLIQANILLLGTLNTFANDTATTLNSHMGGSPDSSLRHVGSHIDLNAAPTDIRDVDYTWSGLQDKDGAERTATTVAEALDQINTALVTHQNLTTVSPEAHPASAISVDGTNFVEIPEQVNDVQSALEALDNIDAIRLGRHRSTMHSNGVTKDARTQSFNKADGYRQEVVPVTPATTHVAHGPPGVMPIDNTITGDDLLVFKPDNSNFLFDAQFGQVRVGDHVRINYGNGLEAQTRVESLRFTPGSEWVVRTVKTNLRDTDGDGYDGYDAYVRIDRPLFDTGTHGILAVAPANITPEATFPGQLGSLIVGNPRGAMALGNGFDPNQLDATHYLLHIEFYPSGNPADRVIALPGIDVTGNLGATVGRYTIDDVVQETNNGFRAAGSNYRFIAFEHSNGNFGIMLADAIGGASFAIMNGDNGSGTLVEGAFTDNVVGSARPENFDALGFGFNRANLASPTFQTTFLDSTAARLPTKVIFPYKERDYVVNGRRRDTFGPTYLGSLDTNGDGYWPASIIARTEVGISTVEVTYEIDLDLRPAELRPGKTLVVQPTVGFSDGSYQDVDYGRFIIKDVTFVTGCPGPVFSKTQITVINGIHATGSATGFSSASGLAVNLFFSEDSVGIAGSNMVDLVSSNGCSPGTNYHRLHEVYVTDEGKTFAHERARIPLQTETTANLSTARWHVTDVSPKLRGFLDDNGTNFRRYVRLVILSTSNREFSGYIGKSDGIAPGIERFGVVSTGSKNVPVRFYDESNIDYIEVIFRDDSIAGGSGDTIMSTQDDRAVDIEIFPSLALDDELLKLATCEVNWQPDTGIDNIEYVRDCRPHGSISETEFTQSAKDFIQAGDRHLHANGVIRGLDLREQSADDDRVLFFNGGAAVVDGAVINVNQGSVTIPEVFLSTDTKPATVNWAICVDKKGNFVPIILTTTKQQYFAEDNISGNIYYLPSVTFVELTNDRKDLTLISTITATISSVSLGSIDEARRFVGNETANIPLTWVDSSNNTVGHFRSFEAVRVWLNGQGIESDDPGIKNNKVYVKGTIEINETVDLSLITVPVFFEGDGVGSRFEIKNSVENGFILKSNLTFKNIFFDYESNNGSSSDLIVNGNGALYAGVLPTDGSTNFPLENILIEDCTFYKSTEGGTRSSFINIELLGEATLENIVINRCKFQDFGGSTRANQAAIAIVHDNTGTLPALMMDCKITNNVCNKKQGIHIISSENMDLDFNGPGIHAFGVDISNNSCGVIGYQFSSVLEQNPDLDTVSSGDTKNRIMGATISGNSCLFITHTSSTGKMWDTISNTNTFNTSANGYVKIINNTVSWIQVIAKSNEGDDEQALLEISNNTLITSDPLLLEIWNDGARNQFNPMENIAIAVDVGLLVTTDAAPLITNNKIINTTGLLYFRGIQTFSDGVTITGNIIEGFSDDGILAITLGLDPLKAHVISNNIINRKSQDIVSYITVASFFTLSAGMIVDNFFDSPTVDGSSEDVINFTISPSTGSSWVIERNKNQTGVITLGPTNGNFAHGDNQLFVPLTILTGNPYNPTNGASFDPAGVGAIYRPSEGDKFFVTYDTSVANDEVRTVTLDISLEEVLPKNVEIISAEITASADAVAVHSVLSLGFVVARLIALQNIIDTDTILFTDSYTPDDKLKATVPGTGLRTGVGSGAKLQIQFTIQSDSDLKIDVFDDSISGDGIIVRYRW